VLVTSGQDAGRDQAKRNLLALSLGPKGRGRTKGDRGWNSSNDRLWPSQRGRKNSKKLPGNFGKKGKDGGGGGLQCPGGDYVGRNRTWGEGTSTFSSTCNAGKGGKSGENRTKGLKR